MPDPKYGDATQTAMMLVFPKDLTEEQVKKLTAKIVKRLKDVSKVDVATPAFQTFDPNYEGVTLYVP